LNESIGCQNKDRERQHPETSWASC